MLVDKKLKQLKESWNLIETANLLEKDIRKSIPYDKGEKIKFITDQVRLIENNISEKEYFYRDNYIVDRNLFSGVNVYGGDDVQYFFGIIENNNDLGISYYGKEVYVRSEKLFSMVKELRKFFNQEKIVKRHSDSLKSIRGLDIFVSDPEDEFSFFVPQLYKYDGFSSYVDNFEGNGFFPNSIMEMISDRERKTLYHEISHTYDFRNIQKYYQYNKSWEHRSHEFNADYNAFVQIIRKEMIDYEGSGVDIEEVIPKTKEDYDSWAWEYFDRWMNISPKFRKKVYSAIRRGFETAISSLNQFQEV